MSNISHSIKDWSTTEASNQPDTTDAFSIAGDLRAIQVAVRSIYSQDTIASATTCDIGSKDAGSLTISGTTTITGLGTVSAGVSKVVTFSGALILTYNATSLILPGNANITTVAGDTAEFESLGAGNWRCNWYVRRAGGAIGLVPGVDVQAYDADIPTVAASQAEMEAGTEAALRSMSPLRVAQAISALSSSTQIQPVTASVAGNALTVTINATTLDFRSSTLGSGTVNTRTISSPISVTVSSGSTLGTVNAVAARLAILAIDNAGTVEAAIVNIAGGNQLDETNLISTTAEGGAGAADSASTIYSTTARTNVPYRVVGFVDITEATAGTWATAPSTIQGVGGQALAALSSLGYGQSWQDVKASRALGTTYYNTTGKPIVVSVNIGGTATTTATVNGVVAQAADCTASVNASITVEVPHGHSYVVANGTSISRWAELR